MNDEEEDEEIPMHPPTSTLEDTTAGAATDTPAVPSSLQAPSKSA